MLEFCKDPNALRAIYVIKMVVNILKILVPVVLIVVGGKTFFKAMMDSDTNATKKAVKLFIEKMVIAVGIFFIPVIVTSVVKLAYKAAGNDDGSLVKCFSDANLDTIKKLESSAKCYVCTDTDTYRWEYNKPSDYCKSGWKANGSSEAKCLRPVTGGLKNPISAVQGSANTSEFKVSGGGVSGPTSSNKYATYTNPKNGVTFNLYNQIDSEWARYSLNGNTVGRSGCNLIDSCVIASGYDKSITVTVGYNKRQGNAYPHTAVPLLTGGAYNCYQITDFSRIRSELDAGHIVSIRTKRFTGTDHYMALLDRQNGMIFVGNGYAKSGRGLSGWYNENIVLNGVEYASVCIVK